MKSKNTIQLNSSIIEGQFSDGKKPMSNNVITGAILVVTILLGLLSSDVLAQQVETEEQWSEWQALGEGYVARRKVPANINKNVTERRSKAVQKRLVKLQILLQRQLDKLEQIQAGSGNQNKIRQIEKKIAALEKKIQQQQQGRPIKSKQKKPKAIWARTDSEGLYQVPVSQLAAELRVNEKAVRRKVRRDQLIVTSAGLPVSWHYDSNTDEVIFPGDRYDTFHTDQNAYRLSLGRARDSQPMLESENSPTVAAGSETTFTDTLKFEQEPDLNFATWAVASEPDADYWFWDYLYGGFKDLIEVPIVTPNPSPTGMVQMRVTFRGWTDLEAGDEHQVYAEMNGVPVGPTITWDGFEEGILVAEFDQSLLDPSGNNTLSLRNIYAADTHPGQFLDAVEIEYARLPVAIGGKLWMHQAEAGTQTVTGFSSEEIVVIESPTGEAIMRRDARVDPDGAGGFTVTFEAQGGTDFLITERNSADTPIVQGDIPSDLGHRRNAAQYLIIAPRDFEGTAEALAAFRGNRYGRIQIVWLEDIYDEFSHGREDPFAISIFMNQAYRNWRMFPSTVVLIGKGSLDHKDRMGYMDSFLPVIFTDTPWALAASDDRLLGSNGDSPVAIGRFPITSDQQGIDYVNKLISYEYSTRGDNQYQAVLAADNPDEAGEFHDNSDLLADNLMENHGFEGVTKIYHPQDTVRDELILSDTWEAGYVSYDGHGSATQVGNGTENFIRAADAEQLQNTTHPIFAALTCASGDSTYPGSRSLAEALVLNPDGGAIASMAPTGLSLDQDAQLLGNAFVDSLYGGYNTIGNAVLEAKNQTQGTINGFMQRMYTVVGDPAVYAR